MRIWHDFPCKNYVMCRCADGPLRTCSGARINCDGFRECGYFFVKKRIKCGVVQQPRKGWART